MSNSFYEQVEEPVPVQIAGRRPSNITLTSFAGPEKQRGLEITIAGQDALNPNERAIVAYRMTFKQAIHVAALIIKELCGVA